MGYLVVRPDELWCKAPLEGEPGFGVFGCGEGNKLSSSWHFPRGVTWWLWGVQGAAAPEEKEKEQPLKGCFHPQKASKTNKQHGHGLVPKPIESSGKPPAALNRLRGRPGMPWEPQALPHQQTHPPQWGLCTSLLQLLLPLVLFCLAPAGSLQSSAIQATQILLNILL